MIAVIFELEPKASAKEKYFSIAGALKPLLETMDGLISIERFRSLNNPDKYLSLSFWRDEEAVAAWRNCFEHRAAQQTGRSSIFKDYHLRVAEVIRDYGMFDREQSPQDSRDLHDSI